MAIKRAVSVLLSAVLLISIFPLNIFASNIDFCIESETFETGLPMEEIGLEYPQSPSKTTSISTQSYSGAAVGVNFYEQLENDTQRAVYNALKGLDGSETTLVLNFAEDEGYEDMALLTFYTDEYPILPVNMSTIDQTVYRNVQVAIEAFQKDCPETFWVKFGESGTSFNYSLSGDYNPSGGYVWETFKITFSIVVKAEHSGSVAQTRAQLQQAVVDFPITGTSRYQICQSIHDGLARTVTFDLYSDYVNEATGALLYGRASAEGYSKAFKLICDYYDVPTMIVSGKKVSSYGVTNHMWNYVLMEDDQWYLIDCEWDDQTTEAYIIIYYDFFLVGSQTYAVHLGGKKICESHLPLGDFSGKGYKTFVYPTLSETSLDVDYTALTIALQLEPKHPDENYTVSTITAFNNAIIAGLNVDPFLTSDGQCIIDQAVDAILTAYNNLEVQYFLKSAQGSTAVIDRANHTIYGLDVGVSGEELMSSWLKTIDQASVEIIASGDVIGTGTVIEVYINEILQETLTVLIFGDVDCDGYTSATDALYIDLIVAGLNDVSGLNSLAAQAADANHDGTIDALDSALLKDAGLFLQTVDQTP
ncbi:MAG TPA: dockerin type I domain-containing protein [Clostridia bacterium]|nr:dockerin type I domain-containing protein [Clostridia bacterium]